MKEEEIKYWLIATICEKKDGKEGLLKLLDDAVCFVSVNMEEE